MNFIPLVSVIVPAYNSSKYIEDCVQSVLNQTFKDFELIIINDGSTDNTLEIINNLSKTDNRIKIFSQKNSGVSSARNLGLKKAKGKYITFLDSDDTLVDTALSSLISEINDNVDFVICSLREIHFSTVDLPFNRKIFINKEQIKNNFIEISPNIIKPCANLYRKSIIDDYNITFPSDIPFGEDHIFNLEYLKYTEKAVVISDKIVYNYMILHSNTCSAYNENMNTFEKIIYLKIAEFFGGIDNIPKKYHNHYVGCYVNGCIEYYISQTSFKNAVLKVKETFYLFEDLLNSEIINALFNNKQQNLINSNKFKQFVLYFILKHPKETIVRKIKKNVKNILKKLFRM